MILSVFTCLASNHRYFRFVLLGFEASMVKIAVSPTSTLTSLGWVIIVVSPKAANAPIGTSDVSSTTTIRMLIKRFFILFLLYVDNSFAYLFKVIIHFSVFYYKYLS